MTKKPKQITKVASFTDHHWGAKNNSEQHLQDCDRYIDWFCDNVRSDPSIQAVIFMGDWYENRSALNIMTLTYSHRGAEKLNELGLPIYFIIGNHDLYHKHTRALYSTITFDTFSNFIIVNEPTVFPELGNGGALLSPYLFADEYPSLMQYRHLETWWGHFEFKDFVITGYNVKLPHGPDAADFDGPKRIFTGHFHKRQHQRNVYYIGNTFPTNFGDVDDDQRGMMIYDHTTNKATFLDWKEGPTYRKLKLSTLIAGGFDLPEGARLKCVVDVEIPSQDLMAVRTEVMAQYKLREFTTEEDMQQLDDIFASTEVEVITGDDTADPTMQVLKSDASVSDMVITMLDNIQGEAIDKMVLIEEYRSL